MKKTKMLAKILLLTAPVMFGATIIMAQTDDREKKPGNKTAIAAERKSIELQNKKAAKGTTLVSETKLQSASGVRPCVTSVRKNPNEVTQTMLNKMPKDRQEFVKAHPERYTIVN